MDIATDIEQRTLSIMREVGASREKIFAAWAHLKLGPCWRVPEGYSVSRCELDFRQGGGYRFCMRAPDGTEHCGRGEFTYMDAPNRLVFTWLREDNTGEIWCDTMVSVTLEKHGNGSRIILEQTAFQTEEQRAEHYTGWHELLERLTAHLEPATTKSQAK